MLQYILKLTISLTVVYLFYQLFLRRLTFYNCNRWYLLIYSMVCFIIPVINVFTIIVQQPSLRESAIINYIPAITQMPTATGTTTAAGINWLQVSVLVIITGMVLMIARLLVQYYSLYKMRSKAVLLYDDKVKLYHIDAPVMPFSFGRGIYVNKHQHSEQELKEIIRHEFIHVKQRHSLDIIWSELLCILNWYNPFAWLLRHDIRQNLEFIADQQVLQTGLDRKQYQYLLLKVIGVNSFSIATNFNFSSLKKRIAMMNKAKSARVHLIRFLFLLPLLIVVLLAFRNSTQDRQQPLRGVVTDTLPKAAKELPGWKEINTIDVTDSRKVTIRLKNGKVEHYDLMIKKEKEAFEQKYGALPEPPKPPIPPAPAKGEKELPEPPEAPEKPELTEVPEKPEAREAPELAEVREIPEKPEVPEIAEVREVPVPPPPPPVQVDCFNKKGYCITVVDNYGECVVIVKDKNNKILQAVSLTDWNKDAALEAKYGEIPPRPVKVIVKQGKPPYVKSAVKVNPITLYNVTPDRIVYVNPKTSVELKNLHIEVNKAVKTASAVKVTSAVSAKSAVQVTEAATQAKVAADAKAKVAAEAKKAAEAKPKAEAEPKPLEP
jgi:hypothetical protein